jgi:SPP1 family predicted phage head-tail adaptor
MIKTRAIGQLNRRLEAQKLTKTANGSGGFTEAWPTVYTTWAYVGPIKSMRDMVALQNVQGNSYEVFIRYTPSHEVSKDIRFLYEGKILVINSQQEYTEGRKRFVRLILVEQV